MSVRIQYKNQLGIEIETICILGSFSGYDAAKGKMHQEGEFWVYEAEFPPGEYYYKFLINEAFLLNDSFANCYAPRRPEEKELWSVLKIGLSGERLYFNAPTTVNVEEYFLSGVMTDEAVVEKRFFSTAIDKKTVARFGFNNIQGIHSVTVLWCDSTRNVREYTEQILCPEPNAQKAVIVWFWLDIKNLEQPEGIWTMKLLIDGKYILEDKFQIGNAFSYSQDGKIKKY